MAGIVLWILLACVAPFSTATSNPRWRSIGVGVGALLELAGSAPHSLRVPLPFCFGAADAAFFSDALAGWFLMVIGLCSLPLALYLPAYIDHLPPRIDRRQVWIGLPLLLASMALVVLAANVPTFLVGWELMSLSSFALVAADHTQNATRRASLIYLAATRLGTAFLVTGFIWAHAVTGSWDFAAWHHVGQGCGLLLLVGLCVKAGVWPFHIWLPVAHPAAPAPASALMSGVMVKVALYAMLRFFVLGDAFQYPLIGSILMGLGAISALWGMAFAILQHDLKRLLAYCTVENVGLIVMGIGAAVSGVPAVAHLTLAAALFHTLNHAVSKSLLFLGAGAVDAQSGSHDMDHLGGLGKRMATTYACFVAGSVAICALPPLNGFASEWLLYQGALRLAWSGPTPGGRFLATMGIGLIAVVGAMAVAAFVKTIGVTFLGVPRSPAAGRAHEGSRGMQAAQVLLAGVCVALGLFPGAVVSRLQPLLTAGDPIAFPATAPLLGLLALTLAAGALWLRGPVRTYVTWECGFGQLPARAETTSTSFVQPIARMFGALYHYAVHLHIEGKAGRLFPEHITVESSTESFLEQRLYTPLWRLVEGLAERLVHLQTGSIHLYLLTMFVTLLILLYVGGRGL